MNEHQIGLYLNALRETRGLELKASKAAGVSRSDIAKERQRNPEFVEQEQEIMAGCVEQIHEALWHRGVDGVDKNVYFKGEVVAVEKQYSDSLLLALAKYHDKGFADKKIVTGDDNVPIRIEIADFSGLADKQQISETVAKEIVEREGLA